jgi:hypothetical protein
VTPQLGARYRQWQYFQLVAGSNILQMDAELQGGKRIPTPVSPK